MRLTLIIHYFIIYRLKNEFNDGILCFQRELAFKSYAYIHTYKTLRNFLEKKILIFREGFKLVIKTNFGVPLEFPRYLLSNMRWARLYPPQIMTEPSGPEN